MKGTLIYMKKKSVFALLLAALLITSVSVSACSKKSEAPKKPKTLEEYAVNNPDVQKSIKEATSQSDVEVDIKGNDVIYTFELSKMDEYTEEVAHDEAVVESLQKVLDGSGGIFGGVARTLEETTGISGIKVIVYYTYEGETIVTQTFDASDAESADASSGDGSSDEGSEEGSDSDTDAEGESADEEAETESSESAE